jgi:UDP-N-acetylglucosamine--N-acetylmuramyl-(pentapeptide) pyrophosphoryl-undecaprenol N-acetylglucosamine transferase
MTKTVLMMAGGTGGHIFPGIAVAEALRAQGWQVHWLGSPQSMESKLIPARGFAFHTIDFSGVRGKGRITLALLPMRLLQAFWQSVKVIRRVKPDVVVGLGGYISFPAGMMAALMGKPLVLHEQNSVAGMANKVLSWVADKVFTAFPDVMTKGEWVGNPLRSEFLLQAKPAVRFSNRATPLKLLVVGGSLGAKALNDIVPKAVALIPVKSRPNITHQSGEKQIDELRANYAAAGVEAELTPFIENTAAAFANADFIICRAGASTVTEISAVGAAAVFVPYPSAVDDHQTTNARFLSDRGAAKLIAQKELTPEKLANLLLNLEFKTLLSMAQKAKDMQKIYATEAVVLACEVLTSAKVEHTKGVKL